MPSLLVLVQLLLPALTLAGLRGSPEPASGAEVSFRNTLLVDIARALGVKHTDVMDRTVSEIEDLLAPIVVASPKNAHGRLDAPAARYALQRVFMVRHGWVLKGYDIPVGDEDDVRLNASFSIFQFRNDVPMEVRRRLEREVAGERGSSAVELAIFAATLEHLIAEERFPKILAAFQAHGYLPSQLLQGFQVQNVIDLHMACYISGVNIATVNPNMAFMVKAQMATAYHDWEGAKRFFRSIEESQRSEDESQPLALEQIVKIVASVERNFPFWNNQQCATFKEQLVEMEIKNSGRVPLSQFYYKALHQPHSTFLESVDYLRELGVLDETTSKDPRIILSNYIEGPSNCVARTAYYSVCCVDECADLFSHIEIALGKPKALPAEIIPVVEDLTSASMSTCRKVPSVLWQRLDAIARMNNGFVPLHGHDFAEWMHLAYPRECSYSKVFGKAHYMTVEEWQSQAKGMKVEATLEEMQAYAKSVDANSLRPQDDTWDIASAASWTSIDLKDSDEAVYTESKLSGALFLLALPDLVMSHSMAAAFVLLILYLKFGHTERSGSTKESVGEAPLEAVGWNV